MKTVGPRNVTARTGRDGRIDYAAKLQLNPVARADEHTYRVLELVGTSGKSIEEAIKSAIERTHQTIRHLRWFEVAKTSGHIDHGKVSLFQVTLKVGFTMEDRL